MERNKASQLIVDCAEKMAKQRPDCIVVVDFVYDSVDGFGNILMFETEGGYKEWLFSSYDTDMDYVGSYSVERSDNLLIVTELAEPIRRR